MEALLRKVEPDRTYVTEKELKAYLEAQLEEMERHIWCRWIESGHDPLHEKTINEYCIEWIEDEGAEFRKKWFSRHFLPNR